MTEEQQRVVEYLERQGVEVRPGVNRKGYVEFKPIGASTFGGCVFENGTVHILNEHTEPFDEATTTYYQFCRDNMPMIMFRAYWKDYKRENDLMTVEKDSKLKKMAESVSVELSDTPEPVADMVWWLDNGKVRRAEIEDFCRAIETGSLRLVPTGEVVDWINDPPTVWQRRRDAMNDAKTSEDMALLKERLKSNTPALVQAQACPTHRIVWLDVDVKDNDPMALGIKKRELWEDDRVVGVFRTISGGLAIGVGLHAKTQSEYVGAMKRIQSDFESDYKLKIDETCLRWNQLRYLAHDEEFAIKDKTRHYKGYSNMNLEEMQALSDSITSKVKETAKRSRREMRSEPCMLDELAYAVRTLGINVCEDRWTGKRTYTLHGKEVEKIDSLWLAIKDMELKDNNNCWKIAKDDAIGYLTANAVIYKDVVMETIFNGVWDGVERWSKLKAALRLDEFGLTAFQLWFRQGVGLLENRGEAGDLQRNFMLILYSKQQNIGKSHLVRAISCGTNSFTQKNLDVRSKDTLADLYSHWIHEFGELGTTFRRKDINDLKNYVTNTAVAIRRPYDRDATTYPVRTSIIGTTNDSDLFTDDTGNRRYIVIDCKWTRADWPAIDALDFKQLWLQAKEEYDIERSERAGQYPYLMSAEYQVENDYRCKAKMVRTREMYVVSQLLRGTSGDMEDVIRSDQEEVVIVMSRLLQKLDIWGVRNINDYNLKRALKQIGFKEYQTITDTLYVIDRHAYDDLKLAVMSSIDRVTKDEKFGPAEGMQRAKIDRAMNGVARPTDADNHPVIVEF